MHNGISLNSKAIEVVENLIESSKKIVFLSNAPRPSSKVVEFLKRMKMKEKYLSQVITSGEAAMQAINQNKFGKNFYHLGPDRDHDLFKGLEKNKKKLEDSDFILCTGLFDNRTDSLEYYKDLLEKYVKLKMVCTNPDLVVYRGSKKEYCAGSVAEIFKNLGGKVIYYGKPYTEIYKFCIKEGEKVLIIGDNIRTDIKGANNMMFDSMLITDGIHKEEFINLQLQNYDKVLNKYNAKTNYYQKRLTW